MILHMPLGKRAGREWAVRVDDATGRATLYRREAKQRWAPAWEHRLGADAAPWDAQHQSDAEMVDEAYARLDALYPDESALADCEVCGVAIGQDTGAPCGECGAAHCLRHAAEHEANEHVH